MSKQISRKKNKNWTGQSYGISNIKKIKDKFIFGELAIIVLLTHFLLWLLSKTFYPVAGPHSFRQAQTNWPMQVWKNFGFEPFAPQVPIKGLEHAAWLLEMPLHQIIVYIFHAVSGIQIDYISRMLSFICGLVTIILLSEVIYRRLHIKPVLSISIFVLNSYFIYWGTTGLVDWISVALGIFSATLFIKLRKNLWTMIYVTITLSLGATVKPSHALIAFLLYLIIDSIDRKFLIHLRVMISKGLLIVIGIAVILSVSWTQFVSKLYPLSDPRSVWSMNTSTYRWYFGSKEQYLNLPHEVLKVLEETLKTSIGLNLFILISLFALFSARLSLQVFLITFTTIGYIGIFINLNLVHTYYQIPVYLMTTVIMLFSIGLIRNTFGPTIHYSIIALLVIGIMNSWKPSLDGPNYFQEVTNRIEPVKDCPAFVTRQDWILTFQTENPYNFYFCQYRSFMVVPDRLPDLNSAHAEISVFRYVYAQNEEQRSLAMKFLAINGRYLSPTDHPSYYQISLID